MSNVKNKVNILIIDAESILAMDVIQTLSLQKNYAIHLISSKKWIESRFSNRVKSFTYFQQTSKDKDFIEFLIRIACTKHIDVILPIQFNSIYLISKYKSLFESIDLNILVSSIESLEIANNKWKLSKFLNENGFIGPKTFHWYEMEGMEIEKLKFPLLMKPLKNWNGNGIVKINESTDLQRILTNNKPTKEFIFQEYISGEDYCINVICLNGEILAHTIQKGILPKSNPFQPHLGFDFVQNEELYLEIKKLMKELNWSGIANFDIRFDTEKNKFYIIEINPRFWGSVKASAIVGVNFSHLICILSLKIPFIEPIYKLENFISNRGVLQLIFAKIFFRKKRAIEIQNNSLYLSIKDPIPVVFKYVFKLIRKLNRKGNHLTDVVVRNITIDPNDTVSDPISYKEIKS